MNNLADLDFAETSDSGAPLYLKHPTQGIPLTLGEGDAAVQVVIMLRGRDSQAFIEAGYSQAEKAQETMMELGKLSPPKARDYEQAHALALCVIGWKGVPLGWVEGSRDNDPVEFSYDNALRMFRNRGVRWVREQCQKFVDDRANFLSA